MRTKKLWNQMLSILLVIALLPVSALAELHSEDTAHPDAVNKPEFTATVSHINPEYERLGVRFPKPTADCMTMAETTVGSMEEAAEYLREQMEDRVTEVTISVGNYTFVDGAKMQADWKTILYGALAHTGVSTQGDYIVRHYGKSEGKIGYDGISTATFVYNIVYDTTLDQENAVGDKIDELFAAWDSACDFSTLSDYEQVKVIYDYICENVVYDYDNLYDDSYMLKYSAYAALINGTAVCQGYANLFYRMALEAGIDTRIIVGDGGGPHGWNIVELGDYYYYLDATWDASRAEMGYPYEYFLLGSDNFCIDHTPEAEDPLDCDVTTYPIDTADYNPDTALLTEATEAGLLTYFDTVTMSAQLTRLAFAKLSVVLKDIPLETDVTLPYTDCDTLTDEEKQIIATVIKHGIMTGSDDGTVRPFGTYTRAQTATLVYRVFDGLQIDNISDYADDGLFSDVENSAWYAPYVNYLASIGMIATSEDGKFYPNDTADLRATLRWILNAMDHDNGDSDEPAIIASGECGENLTWTLTEDGVLTISGEGKMADYNYGATPWYGHNDVIISVVIEDGVTTIGDSAFCDCNNIKNIVIGNGVTSIGEGSFFYCSSLVNIELSNNVTSIGHRAFNGCSSLSSIVIPDSVTNIGDYAFSGCDNLTSVTIPDSVTTIGDWAFGECTSLTSVTIPNSVMTIGDSAFDGCYSLTSITIPDSVTTIDDSAFYNCDNLTTVYYGGTEEQWNEISIGWGNEPLLNAEIIYTTDEDIDTEDAELLAQAEAAGLLKYLTVSDLSADLTRLDTVKLFVAMLDITPTAGATIHFNDCDNLTQEEKELVAAAVNAGIIIGTGDNTFAPYASLTRAQLATLIYRALGEPEVEISKTFSDVPENMWYYESVTALYNLGVFDGVSENTFMPAATATIEQTLKCMVRAKAILDEDNGDKPEIPEDAIASGECGKDGDNLTWTLTEDGTLTISGEGMMEDYLDWQSVPWYLYSAQITDVVISDGVTSIGNCAFWYYTSFTNITIPDSVITIGNNAFRDCSSLVNITMPDSVVTIGDNAFYNCTSLTNIIVPDSVTEMGTSVFAGCTALTSVTLGSGMSYIEMDCFGDCTALTSITIPNSVTYIGGSAFNDCTSLASVTIPVSVTGIDFHAFDGCDALTTVYYGGTEEQWNNIYINPGNTPLLNAEIIFEGEAVHTHTEEIIPAVAPTCTEDGLTEGKKCATCGEILVAQEVISATGHTSTAWIHDDENHWHECSVCGEKFDVAAHEWEEVYRWENCWEPGGVIYDCTICLHEIIVELPQTPHTEVIIPAVPATCTESGWTEGVMCSECEEYIVMPEEIPAKGHSEEIIPGYNATCTEDGLTEGMKCATCGEILVEQDIIPATGHAEEVVLGFDATCTEDGLTEGKKCSVCGEILIAQEVIPAMGHSDENGDYICDTCGENLCTEHTEEVISGYDATCTEDGLTEGKKCSICGEILVAQEVIPAMGHTEEVILGYDATCTEDGLTEGMKCTTCGEILVAQEVIPAMGHSEEIIYGFDATCTEDGLTDGTKCATCGEILVAQEVIPAMGHDYDEGIVTTEPTCTESGVKTYTCLREGCDHSYTEEIPATGHIDENGDYICDNCGENLCTEHIEEIIPGFDATCTEDGLTEGTKCSICGEILVEQQIIPAKGHTEEVISGYDATLTAPGLTDGVKCSVCGTILVAQEEIPALTEISGTCGENLTWTLTNEGVLTISGEGAMYNFTIILDLLPLRAVPMNEEATTPVPWSEYTTLITKVVVEDGVTSIGDNAFAACENLKEIEIPETVTAIGDYVFTGCEALETVTYTGSEEQWAEIARGEGNEPLEDAEIIIKDIVLGDVNENGVVDLGDVQRLFMYYRNLAELTENGLLAADVNRNGTIDLGDVQRLFMHYRGLVSLD